MVGTIASGDDSVSINCVHVTNIEAFVTLQKLEVQKQMN
jgi:hypothetical protein